MLCTQTSNKTEIPGWDLYRGVFVQWKTGVGPHMDSDDWKVTKITGSSVVVRDE